MNQRKEQSMQEASQVGTEQVQADAGAEANGNSFPLADSLGGVTPAGYHRGQNPIEVNSKGSEVDPSIIPGDIMEKILFSEQYGKVVYDEIGLDGITLTSKQDGQDDACEILASHGFIISPRESGLKWYRKAYDIEGGGVVGWDYRGESNSWILELPGEQWMRDHERCRAATFEITDKFHMRCTRVDIRRDQYGQGLQLIDNIGRACREGLLKRVRRFRPMHEFAASSPSIQIARGWYLGSTRSERFLRVYDKGLERGLITQAWWERCEAELRKDLADASWKAIVKAGDKWVYTAFDHLVGVVDFRIDSIRHATLEELDQPEWWAKFCNGREGVRPAIQRDPTDAVRFLKWLSRCVIPTIEAVRQRSGLKTLTDVWEGFDAEFRDVQAGGSELAIQGLVAALPSSALPANA